MLGIEVDKSEVVSFSFFIRFKSIWSRIAIGCSHLYFEFEVNITELFKEQKINSRQLD